MCTHTHTFLLEGFLETLACVTTEKGKYIFTSKAFGVEIVKIFYLEAFSGNFPHSRSRKGKGRKKAFILTQILSIRL